jgi:uncharacterized protein (DUF58 family)
LLSQWLTNVARLSFLRPPWIVWRKRDGDCEIVIELCYATPLVCAAVLLMAHLAGATPVTAALLTATLATIATSALWTWQMARHVRGERRLEARRVQVGDLMEERFALRNQSSLPVLWAEVTDHSNVPGYSASVVRAADSHGETLWTNSGTATRRGEFHLGPWSVETGDPLGIFAVCLHYPQARPLLVYPPLANLPFPPLPRGASPGPSRINLASPLPTVNAGQVRAYELGDPFRHVHWPSTARHEELMVKMFDQEASANVWLLVDTDPAVQSGQGDSSTEEVGVIVAASLAADLLREGRTVGLVTYTPERHIIWPARSTGHLWTILGELARLPNANNRLETSEGLRDLRGLSLVRVLNQMARLLRAGSNLVIVTPSSDPAWVSDLAQLAWRQITPIVILIDPAPEGRPTMSHVAAWLAEQGVACRSVRCDVPLTVRPALGKTRQWEFKTLATGRAIVVMAGVQ